MFISVVLSYLAYACVTAFTPGPNNIVALYAVGQNGWRKGRGTILGISVGFLAVMLLCAVFCYELAKYIPSISGVLQYVGAGYILWLAYCVARSKPHDGGGQPVSFWKAVLLQFANGKIILFAITAYTGYVLPVSSDFWFLIANALCFSVIGMSGVLTWAAAGGVMQTFLSRHYRFFNIIMALVLVICAIQLL